MSLRVIFKKLQRNLNDYGLRAAFGKGFSYLFKRVYQKRTYRIYRRDLRGVHFPEPVLNGIVLRLVDYSDAQVIRQIENMEEWLHGFLPAIMSKGICVGAFDGPRVVGFNIVALQEVFVSLLNFKKRLLPHEAWSEQITVLKEYRKQGLASALRYRVFAELQKRGVRQIYSGSLISNIPSQKAAEKVGFRFIADVHYLRVLNRERRIWRRSRHDGY